MQTKRLPCSGICHFLHPRSQSMLTLPAQVCLLDCVSLRPGDRLKPRYRFAGFLSPPASTSLSFLRGKATDRDRRRADEAKFLAHPVGHAPITSVQEAKTVDDEGPTFPFLELGCLSNDIASNDG